MYYFFKECFFTIKLLGISGLHGETGSKGITGLDGKQGLPGNKTECIIGRTSQNLIGM